MMLTNLLVLITIYFLTIISAKGEIIESTSGEKESSEENVEKSNNKNNVDEFMNLIGDLIKKIKTNGADTNPEKTVFNTSSPNNQVIDYREGLIKASLQFILLTAFWIVTFSSSGWTYLGVTIATFIFILVSSFSTIEKILYSKGISVNKSLLFLMTAILTGAIMFLLFLFNDNNLIVIAYLLFSPFILFKLSDLFLKGNNLIIGFILVFGIYLVGFFISLSLGKLIAILFSGLFNTQLTIISSPMKSVESATYLFDLSLDTDSLILPIKDSIDRTTVEAKNKFSLSNIFRKLSSGTMNKVKTLGPVPEYYFGKVDDGQKQKVGVFMENFRMMTDKAYVGEPIYLTADLVGSSFLDKPIRAYTSCRLSRMDYSTEGSTEPASVELDYNMPRTITCKLPRIVKEGLYTGYMGASFNFETWAYITYTFVDRKLIYNYNSQHKDINKELSINPKPVATYTSGPVKIGISSTKQPIDVNTESTDRPVEQQFSFTIDNAWYQGSIKQINNITVLTPKEISLTDCLPISPIKYENSLTTINNDFNSGFNKYVFRFDDDTSKEFDSRVTYKTINCKIKLSDDALSEISLSSKTLATFIIKVNYDYLLEKKLSIPVRS